MDVHDEPELMVCTVCGGAFWTDAYTGCSDICPGCDRCDCEVCTTLEALSDE